jgi:AcrR family transcriptional regulator
MTTTRRESRAWRSKHDRILGSALEEFIVSGYDGASMDRIAGRAKVSKVTIYNHFKNKDELYEQVLEVHLEHLSAVDYGSDLHEDLAPQEALTRYSRRLLDVFLLPKTIGVTRLLAIDIFRQGGARRLRPTPQKRLPDHARLSEYLGRIGPLRIERPEIAARQLVGMLLENTFNRRLWGMEVDDSDQAIGAVIESSVRVFLDHYCAKV